MRKLFYLFAVIGAFVIQSCTLPSMVKMAKEQKLTVTPNPLEVHKDTVVFDMSANLPVKMLKKGTAYSVNTFYKYNDKELSFDPIQFKAEDYPNASTTEPKANKTYSFPYQAAYKTGVVQVEGSASKGTKAKVTPRMDVATGIITTSKLVQNSYYAAFAAHGYDASEEIVPVTIPNFFFEQGKSVLRKTEITGETGKQLDAFIAAKNITKTVTITGTHSPEGRERINSKLAEERAAAIEKFYRDEMKKYDYQGVADQIQFIPKPIIDDWNGFKAALSSYEGISADDKAKYLDVINAGGPFEETEKKLQSLPGYRKILKDVYPGLRTAKTEILTVKKKKTDAEMSVLAKQITQGQTKSDTLTFEEMMYAASLTPSLEEKAAIYEAATKKGQYWNAHNNLAATYLAQAMENSANAKDLVAKAAAQLDIAAKLKTTSEVNANLATVALWQGNPWKAYSYASSALSGANNDVSSGVNGVKGASEIYMAKYADAVRSTSSSTATYINLFNKGLSQLLNKDYSNASSSFAESAKSNDKFALAHYGAAVAAARQSNAEGVVSNLVNAVKIDPSLKDAALTDLEFAKWSATDAFRNALK
jgi:hypothetical protein